MLDLKPEHLQVIQEILKENIPNKRVLALGSRVNGTAHEGSDLDLVVMDVNNLQTPTNLAALREAFVESNLPIIVDLIDWAGVSEVFREEIKKKTITVQEPS